MRRRSGVGWVPFGVTPGRTLDLPPADVEHLNRYEARGNPTAAELEQSDRYRQKYLEGMQDAQRYIRSDAFEDHPDAKWAFMQSTDEAYQQGFDAAVDGV